MISLVRTAPPSTEPVSLTDAKTHLRVVTADEDSLITTLIQVAREWAEQETQRALITQTWRLSLDYFPVSNQVQPPPTVWDRWPLVGLLPLGMRPGDVIPLPMPPLLSVTSVAYTDTNGQPQTLDPATYVVDTDALPGRIVRAYGASWPTALAQRNAVKVTYVAGFGSASTDVPAAIRQAMLLTIGDLYENRESQVVSSGASFAVNPAAAALLGPFRVLEVG